MTEKNEQCLHNYGAFGVGCMPWCKTMKQLEAESAQLREEVERLSEKVVVMECAAHPCTAPLSEKIGRLVIRETESQETIASQSLLIEKLRQALELVKPYLFDERWKIVKEALALIPQKEDK